jgi:phosphoenolpyruvate carboxylase
MVSPQSSFPSPVDTGSLPAVATGEHPAVDPLAALRADVRYLGSLLGVVIHEQHGEDAFQKVEHTRALAKARRSEDANGVGSLLDALESQDTDSLRVLIKAFSNYFQLINIAEDQQRIRVLRAREGAGTLDETIHDAVQQLRQNGTTAAQMRALLEKIRARLVITAHPSEAKRKEMLVKLREIARLVAIGDRPDLLPREHRQRERRLIEEIEELWQTRPTRSTRPTVLDEVEFAVYFLTSSIMDIVLDAYADLRDALSVAYPDEDWTSLPPLLNFASWVGGDRDGNPNVTADVTLETIRIMREASRSVYLQEIAVLREHLTQSSDEIGVSPELIARLNGYARPERAPDEVYRHYATMIEHKLRADLYPSRRELLDDLQYVYDSLMHNQGRYVATGTLRRLMDKIRLFGLHLVGLDVREDARLQRAALHELFAAYNVCDDYNGLSEHEKQALLRSEIANARPLFPLEPKFSETTNRVIDTWRMIAAAHRRYGTSCIDSVIASMSTAPSDLLGMLLMAHEVGIWRDVDLVPLFETIDDLEAAPGIMRTLFEMPEYRAYLETRGMRQQIMLGYSDSNKDGGYFASNFGLYMAQQQLADTCAAAGIAVELFHGRGGSIGRGGGPTNRAILAQPPGSCSGPIKITEQGEVIAYRYGNADIGRRHLNQLLHALVISVSNQHPPQAKPVWLDTMKHLAHTSKRVYRELVYETPGFLQYWRQATPINELSELPIGSRPAKRSKGGFESIRAIPWMFSWMQSRAIIPSWYGTGTALQSVAEQPDGMALLREMYHGWRFFETLIENAELDLAKADMGIAGLYASLVDDQEVREQIFRSIYHEYALTCRLICEITGQDAIMARSPVLKVSIDRRNPYIDPLNFIQTVLLRRLRQAVPGTTEHEKLLDLVLATINGIAAGMKTTG